MQRLLLVIVVLLLIPVGCSPDSNSGSQVSISSNTIPNVSPGSETFQTSKHVSDSTPPNRPRSLEAFSEEQRIVDNEGTAGVEMYDRKIIYTASITLEVSDIEATINAISSITSNHGGFVENLTTHGGKIFPQANITIRVPQKNYESTIASLKTLGIVESHNASIEDVSSQVIDINARLKSLYTQETSLRNLLSDAEGISDILSIESELTRVRSEIEKLEGQMQFLQGKIDMSSIYISIFTPHDPIPEPPSAFLRIQSTKVSKRLDEIKSYSESDHVIIDRIVSSSNDGRETSTISMRVHQPLFASTLDFLEGQGKILSKEVSEEIPRESESTEWDQIHNSPITVTLTTPDKNSIGVLTIIGISFGAIITGILVWLAFYKTYQAGRNRADRFIQDQSL